MTCLAVLFSVGSSQTREARWPSVGFVEVADTAVVPAYAATIHKSQGSEYPAMIIPLLTQHYAMLQRNLLYTGVTRGKRLVVLVGRKAIAIAVRNPSGRKRWSKASGCGQNRLPLKEHGGSYGHRGLAVARLGRRLR